MFVESRLADPGVHAAAIRIAGRCRFKVQACLREEEWANADREFDRIAREVSDGNVAGGKGQAGAPYRNRPGGRPERTGGDANP
jgi:hypothetical protein